MNASHRIACLFALACSTVAVAGDLTPPGAPAPTMKTIQEAEPRTPISQADVPLVIFKAGSYYLTEDLVPTAIGQPFIIEILVSDVTLDFRGFRIEGATEVATADNGVRIDAQAKNVALQNGTIARCQQRGLNAELALGVGLREMRFMGNGADGAAVGADAHVSDSRFLANGGAGLRAFGRGGVLIDSVANENVGVGFVTGAGATIQSCTASKNQWGFYAGDGSTIANCTALENDERGFAGDSVQAIACNATRNGIDGFNVSGSSTYIDCVAVENAGNGFRITSNETLVGCVARANGFNGFAVGGSDTRLDGCTAVANSSRGFLITGSSNLLIRNNAAGNPVANYDIAGGNALGPIVTAATIAVNTNPHANYEH